MNDIGNVASALRPTPGGDGAGDGAPARERFSRRGRRGRGGRSAGQAAPSPDQGQGQGESPGQSAENVSARLVENWRNDSGSRVIFVRKRTVLSMQCARSSNAS